MAAANKREQSIEDIILDQDKRGISALRPFLPADYCQKAARWILAQRAPAKKPVIITTGFYILSSGVPETDGPPGAIALGRALHSLDFEVFYVTDHYCLPLLNLGGEQEGEVIEFPITDHEKSAQFARKLLSEIKPVMVISTERCGLTEKRRYLNMRGKDISEFTAKVDYLFTTTKQNTLGVGDGGNEIGMGKLASQIKQAPSLPDEPAITPVDYLIIATVSNWGVYGLLAALSILCQQDLVPSAEWEGALLKELNARGTVDGITGERDGGVDAFTQEQNASIINRLKQLVAAKI
jgi:hypothetical protein